MALYLSLILISVCFEHRQAAVGALQAWPGGLQIGGGVNTDNAKQWLDAGASHVIVTSFVFREGRLEEDRLKALVRIHGTMPSTAKLHMQLYLLEADLELEQTCVHRAANTKSSSAEPEHSAEVGRHGEMPTSTTFRPLSMCHAINTQLWMEEDHPKWWAMGQKLTNVITLRCCIHAGEAGWQAAAGA